MATRRGGSTRSSGLLVRLLTFVVLFAVFAKVSVYVGGVLSLALAFHLAFLR